MSVWTRASFCFKLKRGYSNSELEEFFGHERRYNDYIYEYNMFDEKKEHKNLHYLDMDSYDFLPEGSEGTLAISTMRRTKKRTDVVISGGLRHVYSTREIQEWFNKLIEKDAARSIHIIKSAKGWAITDGDKKPKKFNYRSKVTREEIEWRLNNIWFNFCYELGEFFRRLKRKKH